MEGRKNLYTYYYTDEASRLTNAIHCVFSIDLKMFYFSMWKTNWLIALYLFCHIYWKMKKDHRDSNAISHEIEFDYMLQMRNKQTNYTDETNPTSRTNWHTWNFLHDIILCVCTISGRCFVEPTDATHAQLQRKQVFFIFRSKTKET